MNEVARLTGGHTPEDVCKMNGGLTRAQAMEILASKGLHEGPDPFEMFHKKQVRSNETELLHPQLERYIFFEHALKDVMTTSTPSFMTDKPQELIKFTVLEWRPKQYAFTYWVHLYWGRDGQVREASCGYHQTYSWFEWELKGEVNY